MGGEKDMKCDVEPVEMSQYSRSRGCWDAGPNCFAILGESSRKSVSCPCYVMISLLLIAVTLLAMPAAIIINDGNDNSMRIPPTLAESRLSAGARGRSHERSTAGSSGTIAEKVKAALKEPIVTQIADKQKEKLLLNMLQTLEQPCDDKCEKMAGRDKETLHLCRMACRKSKAQRMKHLIHELNHSRSKQAHTKRHHAHKISAVSANDSLRSAKKVEDKLVASARKIAHGDIGREEKLVYWAEKHGLKGTLAKAVLDRLQHKHAIQAAEERASKSAAKRRLEQQTAAQHKHQAAQESKYMRDLSRSQRKLISWAEANGLPKKMAENPADKKLVKTTIARMKAEQMVAAIKSQFRKDDSKVGDIVHVADPSVDKSLYSGLDYK